MACSSCRSSIFQPSKALRGPTIQSPSFFTFCAGADPELDGPNREGRVTGACDAVSPTEGARLEPHIVGGNAGSGDQSREVNFPIPGGGLREERPMVPSG